MFGELSYSNPKAIPAKVQKWPLLEIKILPRVNLRGSLFIWQTFHSVFIIIIHKAYFCLFHNWGTISATCVAPLVYGRAERIKVRLIMLKHPRRTVAWCIESCASLKYLNALFTTLNMWTNPRTQRNSRQHQEDFTHGIRRSSHDSVRRREILHMGSHARVQCP